ncbi:unnamed protein product [Musa textilis]
MLFAVFVSSLMFIMLEFAIRILFEIVACGLLKMGMDLIRRSDTGFSEGLCGMLCIFEQLHFFGGNSWDIGYGAVLYVYNPKLYRRQCFMPNHFVLISIELV